MSETSSSYSSMKAKSSFPNSKKLKKGRVLQAVWTQIGVDSDVLWRQVQEKSTALYNEYTKKESEMEPMEHEMISMHGARTNKEQEQEQDGDDKLLLRGWKQDQ